MNKFIDTLKKNWMGGLVGVSFLLLVNGQPLSSITQFFTSWPTDSGFGPLAYVAKGILVGMFILGAYIQSYIKRR